MTIEEKLEFFLKKVKEKHGARTYNSILNKKPFFEMEDGNNNESLVHELIDEDYLSFIALDILDLNIIKYTVHLSDKAIKHLNSINLIRE